MADAGGQGRPLHRAAADSAAAVDESDEDDNTATLAVRVHGNHVENGSFDQAGSNGAPAAWTSSGSTAPASGPDGSPAVSLTGAGSSWTSSAFAVTPGAPLTVSASVRATGITASVALAFVGAGGAVLDTVTALTTPLATGGFVPLEEQLVAPPGAVQARVVLTGSGAVFDDVDVFDG